MSPLAYSALTAVIFTSAAGALVMCLLVFKYGFAPSPDELPPGSMRRVFITRLGHALAGTCFATTAILAAVTLADLAGVPPAASAATDERRAMEARLSALTSRVSAAESRLQSADEHVRKIEAALRSVRRDIRPVASGDEHGARVRAPRLSAIAEPRVVPPVVPKPAPPAVQKSPASDDLGSPLRRGWDSVKRAFATAGSEFRAAVDEQARARRGASD